MKNNKLFLVALIMLLCGTAFSQNNMGIGTTTPDASAVLDIQSTDKGLLIPRMTATQRAAIATPATGLLVYQTDATTGLYSYDGSAWKSLTSSGTNSTALLPNFSISHNLTASSTAITLYTSAFGLSTATSVSSLTSFFIPENTTFTIDFYSYDDEAFTYELWNVAPVATAVNYATTGTVLATANGTAYSSGAPTKASFTYTSVEGQLLTIKIYKTLGTATTTTGGFFTVFSKN